MRNEKHESATRLYIENNPTKAKIVLDPRQVPNGAARGTGTNAETCSID